MADWKPEKDPYYESLYDETPFDFIDTYRKSEQYLQERDNKELINRANEVKLQDLQEDRDTRTSLSEALKQGGDYREKARQIYIERGDIDGLTKLDKQIVDETYRNIQMDKAELENILSLPPEIAMERFNSGRLGKTGQVTSLSQLYQANRKLQGSVSGGIFSQDPITGQPVIHTQPIHPPGWGQSKEDNVNLITVINPETGQLEKVSPRDPNGLAGGKLPYSETMLKQVQDDISTRQAAQEADQKAQEPSGFSKWFDGLYTDPKRPPANQPQVPNDSKLNNAYKTSPAYNDQKVKDKVVTLRLKQTQGMAQ